MRAVLISTDLVMKSDGTYTPTEINTGTGNHLKTINKDKDSPTYFTDNFADYINHVEFDSFLQSNNITKIKVIDRNENFNKIFNGFCRYYTNYEYELIRANRDSVTVPFVEDADDTIVIRIAYDTTAIVDDLYARDMFEFHNLIKDETFASPVTFNTGDSDNLDRISTFEPSIDGVTPNYVVKKRTPSNSIDMVYPSVYRLENQSQLDNLKESLTNDEFIQKFEYNENNLVDNRVSFIRSIDILYGSDLGVFNLSTTKMVSRVATQNTTLIYEREVDENGKLNVLFASKYYPKIIHYLIKSYGFDATDKLMLVDGSLISATDLVIGGEIKGVQFNQENTEYTKTNVSNLDTLSFTSSSITNLNEKSGSNLFINITAVDENNNSYEWHDGIYNNYLIQKTEEDVIQYIDAALEEIEIGDKIYVYDKIINSMKYLTITNITFEMKDLNTYSITLEEHKREFLIELSENLFLLQHNVDDCIGYCAAQGGSLGCNDDRCSRCGKLSNACVNCGGVVGNTTDCGPFED